MPIDDVELPPSLLARIVTFIKQKSTGQITLHVHQGRVRSVSIAENVRHDDEPPRPAPAKPR